MADEQKQQIAIQDVDSKEVYEMSIVDGVDINDASFIRFNERVARQRRIDVGTFLARNGANITFSTLQSWPCFYFGSLRGLEQLLGQKNPVFDTHHTAKEISVMLLYGLVVFGFNFAICFETNRKLKKNILLFLKKVAKRRGLKLRN